MKISVRYAGLAGFAILFCSSAFGGNLYKCKSADGSIEFSNVACSDQTADRDNVMRLRERQPWERSPSSSMVERANRFTQQRQEWAAQDKREAVTTTPNSTQPLSFSQRQALRNANVGRPTASRNKTAAENVVDQNSFNARARATIGQSGLNPNDYVAKDQPIPSPPAVIHAPATPSHPTYVPSIGKWCQQQGGSINCWK